MSRNYKSPKEVPTEEDAEIIIKLKNSDKLNFAVVFQGQLTDQYHDWIDPEDAEGWIPMGQKNEDEWPFVAREFENRYRGFRERSEIPEYPAVLTGIANAHNRSQGLKLQSLVMIGNEASCERVMNGGTDKPLIGFKQAGSVVPDEPTTPVMQILVIQWGNQGRRSALEL